MLLLSQDELRGGIYYPLLRATSGILNEDKGNDSQGSEAASDTMQNEVNRFRGEVTFPCVWQESEPVGMSNEVS